MEYLGKRLESRLTYLGSLEKGWYDNGQGDSICEGRLSMARELLRKLLDIGFSEPGLFPMEDGSISIEWNSRKCYCIEILESSYWFSFFMSDDTVLCHEEFTFDEIDLLIESFTEVYKPHF